MSNVALPQLNLFFNLTTINIPSFVVLCWGMLILVTISEPKRNIVCDFALIKALQMSLMSNTFLLCYRIWCTQIQQHYLMLRIRMAIRLVVSIHALMMPLFDIISICIIIIVPWKINQRRKISLLI